MWRAGNAETRKGAGRGKHRYSEGGSRGNAGALVDGLNVKNSRASAPCAIVRWRAILSVLVRKNEGRGRSLLVSTRRTIATSRFARGVSLGGSRIHGVIASAFMGALHPQFLMGSRAGGFRARRFRVRGTSYTRTACPPRRKDGQFLQAVHGALAMMRTLSRNVSTAFPSTPEPTFLPSVAARAELRARVSDYLAELIAFCREVESLPAGQNLKEARHG